MRRWGVVAVGLALLASACSDGGDPAVTPGSVAPTAAPGPITLSVVLDDDEVSAGTTITGFLVFENTGEPVDILHGGCTPNWTIALINEEVEAQVAFTDPCPIEPLHIPTGRSQVPIMVSTLYGGCVTCPDGSRDVLPPGTYETTLVFAYDYDDLGGPPPAPVKVTITD
ncbi:MAG: hypothetical protein ABMA25_01790 [Ilumatobacteraceae bacterium]